MRIISLCVIYSLLASSTALGQASLQIINVKVKGLVCSFCAQGLTKRAEKNPKVRRAIVSLDAANLRLWVEGKDEMTNTEIESIVAGAGFKLGSIEREPTSGTADRPAIP